MPTESTASAQKRKEVLDRLDYWRQRVLATKLLETFQDSLFVFARTGTLGDARGAEAHLVNVKTAERKVFRRFKLGPDERYRTAAERMALLDVSEATDLSTLAIRARHEAAFDVEPVTRKFFRDFCSAFDLVCKDIARSALLNDMCLLVPVESTQAATLVKKLETAGEHLGELASVNFGMQLRDRDQFRDDVIEGPVKPSDLSRYHRPCYTGKDIHRFRLDDAKRHCYFNRVAKRGGCWDEAVHNAKGKVLVRQIGAYPEGALDSKGYAVLNTAFMILPKDNRIDARFILAILNSKCVRFFWQTRFKDDRKTFPKIKGEYLK